MIELTGPELAGVILGSVTLAVLDAASLADVLLVAFARKLGVEPRQIREYDNATDGGDDGGN